MGDAVVTSLVGAPVSLFSLQPEISVHATLVDKSGARGRQSRRRRKIGFLPAKRTHQLPGLSTGPPAIFKVSGGIAGPCRLLF